jgi:hypothetical protein
MRWLSLVTKLVIEEHGAVRGVAATWAIPTLEPVLCVEYNVHVWPIPQRIFYIRNSYLLTDGDVRNGVHNQLASVIGIITKHGTTVVFEADVGRRVSGVV